MVDVTLSSVVGTDRPPTTLPAIPDKVFQITTADDLASCFDATTTSATLQTALTIGAVSATPGVLELAGIWTPTGAGAGSPELKITIDGTVVYDVTSSLVQWGLRMAAGGIGITGTASADGSSSSLARLPWRSSCLVEFKSSGGATMHCYYRYYLT